MIEFEDRDASLPPFLMLQATCDYVSKCVAARPPSIVVRMGSHSFVDNRM